MAAAGVGVAAAAAAALKLLAGSEVRVTVDHVVDDALVVSLRFEEKLFSGVLMDISRRLSLYYSFRSRSHVCLKVFSGLQICFRSQPSCVSPPLNLVRAQDAPNMVMCAVLGSRVGKFLCLELVLLAISPQLLPGLVFWEQNQPAILRARMQWFGPYGIPVTVLPKRDYKDKTDLLQLQCEPFQQQIQQSSKSAGTCEAASLVPSTHPSVVESLWTAKPAPLFYEGAPYPPPLFIRHTYNQSIPQPPPRRIKRPKKKMFREESTSIMNSIKLRPRQVLCDRCKNSISADKKELRRGSSTNDTSRNEDKKRKNDSAPAVSKRLKTDHKLEAKTQYDGQKRNTVIKISNLTTGKGKVVKISSQVHSSKVQLNPKKVLQNKNVDHTKAREVLKMAKDKVQKKQQEVSSSGGTIPKVHFTRRFQTTNSGSLPPRIRLKPQRYRNEENDSVYKAKLDRLRSCKTVSKAPPRCTSSRSAGEQPSEKDSPTKGLEQSTDENKDTREIKWPCEQDEKQLGKRGRGGNITVYMTYSQNKSDSSTFSVCSSDSADDIKSSNSECSSTETFDFPPGSMHVPCSSSSKEEKLTNSLKVKVFTKNVSKCVTPDGKTICVGDIVWAKIYGFPWWPARILTITVSRKDNGFLVRQEARISWFGSPTTSFLALSQVSPFLENFQSRFNKKRKGLYRKAITEAAKAAKQLTPEVRALLTQFET
ncbi:PWWP domain-containing protein 2A isoform X4 [Chiloscyllium plagiosum]|uniref:PWWP domain-containing protein 2A isoform X4 n=1 Tax=Chiloscyllium plagiosum TaxID=36176 RepID=UPI001CB7CAB1|nr:PWWP domain-containing protein 2A isoform X4 [Chiloscyllium plagiosum]